MQQQMPILKDLEAYAKANYIPICKPETADFLKMICAIKRPTRILEAGTAIGYSAIIMSEYLADNGMIDTIEIDEDRACLARENIESAELSGKINVITADAVDVFSCLDKEYDIIFLDAAKSQYKQLFHDAKRLLNKGGILISDNIFYDGRVMNGRVAADISRRHRTIVVNMREYLDILKNDKDLETNILSIGDGIAVSILAGTGIKYE